MSILTLINFNASIFTNLDPLCCKDKLASETTHAWNFIVQSSNLKEDDILNKEDLPTFEVARQDDDDDGDVNTKDQQIHISLFQEP